MKGTEPTVVGLVAVLVGLTTVTAGAAVATTDENAVEVGIEDVEASPGETVTVSITTSNVDDLAGYEATVTFDPEVVRVVEVEGVDMDDPIANVDNDNGTVTMTQSAAEAVDANPDPVLAELTLEVVGESGDSTALALDSDELNVNNEFENLRTSANDGSVTVLEDENGDDEGGNEADSGGSNSLPGFTAVGAVGALLAVSTIVAIRRYEE